MRNRILPALLATAILGTSVFGSEQQDTKQSIKQGDSAVTLGMRYASMQTDGEDSQYGHFDASYSYFVTDGLELGLGLGYLLSSGQYRDTAVTVSPYVAYNFVHNSETIVPYIAMGASYSKWKSRSNTHSNQTGTEAYETDGTAFNAELGLKVFVTQDVAIVPALYTISYSDFTNSGLKVGVQFFF